MTTDTAMAELGRRCKLTSACAKSARVVFFADAAHVRRERGYATGRRHAYNGGVEVSVRGVLHSVPVERLVDVKP